MATAVAVATSAKDQKTAEPVEQRVVLQGVSWHAYETLLREVDPRGGVRFTYDDGVLEIMTESLGHEHSGKLLTRFIEAVTEELEIVMRGGRSTTLKEEAKKRGLEPDECYWIKHYAQMIGRNEFDFDTCPPPDLAVEVEVSRSVLDRLGIYASLGIPELWRYDGTELIVLLLGTNGEYVACDSSPTFLDVPLTELVRFLHEGETVDDTTILRSFRKWVRENVLPKWEARKKKKKPQKGSGKKKPH